MKRFAFSLLELVFVIIVIGILAVLAMPNFKGNPLQTAAEQVASHIRYTQHLAMVDDMFDDKNSTWYKSFWRIRFYQNTGTFYYTIFHDSDQNGNCDFGAGKTEVAIDPLNKINFHTSNGNKQMNLTDTYGIISVTSSCDAGYIDMFFDNIGRPYANSVSAGANSPYSNLLANSCDINLTHPDGVATITVRPETGYVSVSYQ